MPNDNRLLRASLVVMAVGSALLALSGGLCYCGIDTLCVAHPEALGSTSELNRKIAIPMLIIGILLASPSMFALYVSSKFKSETSDRKGANALNFLYSSHFMSACGDRMWEIAVPMFLMDIFKVTLLPTALYTVFVYITSVIFMPQVGKWVDSASRLTVQRLGLLLENMAVVCTTVIMVLLVFFDKNIGIEAQEVSSFAILYYYVGLLFFGGLGELMNGAQTLSIEKDWVVAIAGSLQADLGDLNTTLRRIDLGCKALAPGAFAFIYQFCGDTPREKIFYGAIIVGLWNLASFPVELILNTMVYDAFPVLRQKGPKSGKGAEEPSSSSSGRNSRASNPPDHKKRSSMCYGWGLYFSHDLFTASLAYTMLWMTVLDNGSLMTSYLLWRGVPPTHFGFARGAGALFGLMGTSVFLCIRRSVGSLEKSGVAAMWLFWILLAPGVVSFYLAGVSRITDYVLMASMSIGRIGLWSFDLVITQLTQERVSEENRGSFGSAQTASYQFFYVIINLMGIVFHKPSQFIVLVSYSVGVVLLAALLYTKWYFTQQTKKDRALQLNVSTYHSLENSKHAVSEQDAEYMVL